MSFDIQQLREQFPILQKQINKKPFVYLDNAATTQKPRIVIDRLNNYYNNENCNIHRGDYHLSRHTTEAYENTRKTVKSFINAQNGHEIVFTSGTTEAINLVASSFSKKFINKGDEILISAMEHHSNIVPWQLACEEKSAKLKVIPVNQNGEIIMDEYYKLLNDKTRIVAVTHVSNSLGTINPVKQIIEAAHKKNIPVLIDGAQAIPHLKVDVTELDCDFYCFSGHKMYGPMGVGVLYGKEKWLEEIPPYQGGGEMISEVTFNKTTFNQLPFKFEAGTPNVGDVLGLEKAVSFLTSLGYKNIQKHEEDLIQYTKEQIKNIDKIKLIGTAEKKTAVFSFLFEDIHPYDTGVILDNMGIAVRTGHHCTQPLMDFYQIPGTARASMAVYNTKEEIDLLIEGLNMVKKMFA